MVPNIHAEVAYDILGVPHDADMPAIRQAFRKLALKHHPDAVPTEQKAEASRQFARINQAYELLRDSDKRRRYDGLLGRGITPDLSAEVGDVGIASLGDILGHIESLDVEDREPWAKEHLSKEFSEMLFSGLIRTVEVTERVIDLVQLAGVITEGYELPPGKAHLDAWAEQGYNLDPPEVMFCTKGWVVVTDIRVIVLMEYEHEYELKSRGTFSRAFETVTGGGSKMKATYWRARSFPYYSLKTMEVSEGGRAYKAYSLHLVDEDDTSFVIDLKKPRLAQLLLVASVYQLPLRVRSESSATGEVAWAVFLAAVPALLWLVPFVLMLALTFCSSKWEFGAVLWSTHLFLLKWYITPVVVYLTPALLAYGLWRCYRAWSIGVADDVFGEPPTDFATQPPGRSTVAPAPAPPPASDAVWLAAAAEVPRPDPEPVISTQGSGSPLEVDVPDAVREAFGLPAPGPAIDLETLLVCPGCGQAHQMNPVTLEPVRCNRCGYWFVEGGTP